jgi:hypothetical protein
MIVFVIIGSGFGSHEPERVMSVWTTKQGADECCARLNAESARPHYGEYEVREIETDVQARCPLSGGPDFIN